MSFVGLLTIVAAVATVGTTNCQQQNFNNPISPLNFWIHGVLSIFHLDSNYYLIATDSSHRQIWMQKSGFLTSFQNATEKTFSPFPPSNTTGQVEVGKMHLINSNLYLYLSRFENDGLKLYGMKAKNSTDPMGEWETPVAMITDWDIDQGILDGTVMKHGETNYLVFTRFTSRGLLNGIYIRKMLTPTETIGPVVMIKNATETWECSQDCTSDGPAFIYNGNVSYMILSVNSHHSVNRSLTQMSIPFEKDPMDPNNWEHVGAPVFEGNEDEDVFMPEYASFADSPDGTETWMMYLASESPYRADISARLEKISWNPDGSPKFPMAHGYNHSQPVPSGQTCV